jgi:hypothetical protein
MSDTYKVVHVEEENEDHPGLTIYIIERIDGHGITFTFIVKMWDNGIFTLKSHNDKPIGYSTEMRDKAIEAINRYKLMSGLKGDAKDTWGDILS